MTRLRVWMTRLITVFRRGRQERDLAAELQAHLRLHIDQNLRAGMRLAEARRVAQARLGGVEQVKARCREVRPFRWLGTTWLDLKRSEQIHDAMPVGGLLAFFDPLLRRTPLVVEPHDRAVREGHVGPDGADAREQLTPVVLHLGDNPSGRGPVLRLILEALVRGMRMA